MSKTIYDITVDQIDGTPVSLSSYRGKVVLVVNVASKCGLTPQYEGLEKLYEKYKDKGLEILGFPANEFAGQEPGSNDEIHKFCTLNFGVKFPMFKKIVVKGEGMHPLYAYLTSAHPDKVMKKDGILVDKLKNLGLLSGGASDILWNFEKFLIGKDGRIVERFSPEFAPDSDEIVGAIEKELAN
jgi:glutathione peroxidase